MANKPLETAVSIVTLGLPQTLRAERALTKERDTLTRCDGYGNPLLDVAICAVDLGIAAQVGMVAYGYYHALSSLLG